MSTMTHMIWFIASVAVFTYLCPNKTLISKVLPYLIKLLYTYNLVPFSNIIFTQETEVSACFK